NLALHGITQVSDGTLTLEAKPQHALRGEKIVMNCRTPFRTLRGHNLFLLYRNNWYMQKTKDGSFTIKSAKQSDEASYQCKFRIGYREWASNNLSITVSDGSVAFHVVPVSPLEGETLELNCRYRYKIWWMREFTFCKKDQIIHSVKSARQESSYSIKVTSTDDSGLYNCNINEQTSRTVDVWVQERFAEPVLSVEPAAQVFEGLQVTLMCIAQTARPSIRLRYTFYRDGSALEAVLDDGGVYTINAAAADVSGIYACEAIETNYGLRKRSDNTHLSIKEAFTVPKLTVHPEGQLVDGQWFKLVCSVEENLSEASLRYGFYRNGIPLQSLSNHSEYISGSARPADSGTYHCEVTGGKVRKHSNQLHLSIRGIPVSKPELIIQPKKELIEGDAGSLICSVSNGSLPIYYQFYKASSVELYWEISNSTKYVYNIEAISRRDKGLYHCSVKNEITGPLCSEDVEITVI
ncbi:Fc receptor-like protein 5, partial [Rhincodon typus]|uniref:Fc receptor-like protein 5 n=1 Tax=Rhincodon typus TaxID=259920 RepID=UPI002030CA77